VKQDQKNF